MDKETIDSFEEYLQTTDNIKDNKIKYIDAKKTELEKQHKKENLTDKNACSFELRNKYLSMLKTELQINKDLSPIQENAEYSSEQKKKEVLKTARKSGAGFRFRLYFRGVSNKEYLDAAGIYRNGSNGVNEILMQNLIMARCANEFTENAVENLVKLQHYGCPTQLLDVTENPLVALYFACQNEKIKETDGQVRVYAVAERELQFMGSEKIRNIANLTKLLSKIEIAQYLKSQNEKQVLEYLHKETDYMVNNDKCDLQDIFDSYFFIAPQKNQRIIRQNGAFIANGLFENEKAAAESVDKFRIATITISGTQKEKILKDLNSLNINEISLFPDLYKVVEILKKQNNELNL